MDVLTAHESLTMLTRLEECVTALEDDRSPGRFYTVIILAQEFATKTKAPFSFAHLRRCLTLAQRLRPLREEIVRPTMRWTPFTDVVKGLVTDLTQLSSLYSVARLPCREARRGLHQEFRAHFTHVIGRVYSPYSRPKTAKEGTTIRAFWDEVFAQALATFSHTREVAALDRLLACLPAWSTAHQGGWIKQDWREPAVKEVMQVLQDAVRLCEVCMESVGQIATAALAQRPVVERAQITQDVAPQYTAQVQTLRDQLAALPRPKDTPKAQQPHLRHTKAQLQQELKTLLRAQETAIQRQVTAGTNARRKLEKLVAKTPGQRDTLLHRVSKVSRDVLPQMVWIYDYERRGDDDWRAAKRDARRWLRTLRQARAQAEVEATP